MTFSLSSSVGCIFYVFAQKGTIKSTKEARGFAQQLSHVNILPFVVQQQLYRELFALKTKSAINKVNVNGKAAQCVVT